MGPAKFVHLFHMIEKSSWLREKMAINARIMQIVRRGEGGA